jgi:hypothetical protein
VSLQPLTPAVYSFSGPGDRKNDVKMSRGMRPKQNYSSLNMLRAMDSSGPVSGSSATLGTNVFAGQGGLREIQKFLPRIQLRLE